MRLEYIFDSETASQDDTFMQHIKHNEILCISLKVNSKASWYLIKQNRQNTWIISIYIVPLTLKLDKVASLVADIPNATRPLGQIIQFEIHPFTLP